MSVTVAVDAMGGDRAPGEIVDGRGPGGRGARRARAPRGPRGSRRAAGPRQRRSVEVVGATEVVGMTTRPRRCAPRRTRRSWSVPQLVRDGKADAHGQRGQHRRHDGGRRSCASGRIKGVARPAIAAPIPVPGHRPPDPRRRRRHRRLHAGVAGAVRAHGPRVRPHPPRRRRTADRACCRTARKPGKGDDAAQGASTSCSPTSRASSATSRAATSCTPASTSSSPTASPGTSR